MSTIGSPESNGSTDVPLSFPVWISVVPPQLQATGPTARRTNSHSEENDVRERDM
jgi:hypothetical protein